MMKIKEKQIKIVSIVIAIMFIGSVVAIALTQNESSGVARAASGSSVGVIDYRQVLSKHPELKQVEEQMQSEWEAARKTYEEKASGMNEQEKQDYYMQSQERMHEKQNELMEPIDQSIRDAVKKVADGKGLSVVIEKMTVVYGGVDITQEVINKLTKEKK